MTSLLPAPELLLTAFTLGLLGTGHCLAMCGGIAGALGMRSCAPGATLAAPLGLGLNAVGRLASYAALGALAGGIGSVATHFVPTATLVLRTLAGLALVAMGAYLLGHRALLFGIERLGMPVFSRMAQATRGRGGLAEPLLVGAAWGLLPCGLVYGTLTWSLAAASPSAGAALMLAFGAGTLPAVLGAGLLGAPLAELLRSGQLRSAAGGLVIVFGLWTLGSAGHAFTSHARPDAADSVAPTLDCQPRGPLAEPWEG